MNKNASPRTQIASCLQIHDNTPSAHHRRTRSAKESVAGTKVFLQIPPAGFNGRFAPPGMNKAVGVENPSRDGSIFCRRFEAERSSRHGWQSLNTKRLSRESLVTNGLAMLRPSGACYGSLGGKRQLGCQTHQPGARYVACEGIRAVKNH